MAELYQTRLLKSVAEIEEFRDVWSQWCVVPSAGLDFFLTRIAARQDTITPHVLVVLSDGVPKAIAIGEVETAPIHFKVSHKSLFKVQVKTMSLPEGGLLVGDSSAETARALIRALMQTLRNREADAILLPQMCLGSPLHESLLQESPWFCRERLVQSKLHWKMTVPDGTEKIYAGLSGEHRKKLRWQNRNLEKNFPESVRIHCFREPSELEKMTVDVEMIAKRTYQRALGSSFVDNEATRKRVALEAQLGWLRMYVLYLKEQPCAYWWALMCGGTLHSFAMGFDPDYRRYSPGMYLLTKTLDGLQADGVKELDFGAGDFHYKQQFGTDHWAETTSFYVFAPRLLPRSLSVTRTLLAILRATVRTVLTRLKVMEQVKKLLRQKLVPATPNQTEKVKQL